MRVLVCGGRDFNDYVTIYDTLFAVDDETSITCIISGGAPGADYWGESWADMQRIPMERFPADWKTHGRAAGPIRNARMISEGKPDLVIAFKGGRGTADMCEKAESAGIPVRRVDYNHRAKFGAPQLASISVTTVKSGVGDGQSS